MSKFNNGDEGSSFTLQMEGKNEIARTGKISRCEQSGVDGDEIIYGIEDNPPWMLSLVLGFQHYLTAFGSTLSVSLILAGPLCIGDDKVGLGELIATTFFMAGVITLMQISFGVRLPIIQGATFAFLPPTITILNLPRWSCASSNDGFSTDLNSTGYILQDNATNWAGTHSKDDWKLRIREIQGAICLASLFQVAIGLSGVVSVIVRYIGPLTITPTITLMGLALFEAAAQKAASQWWIALTTLFLIALFCQYLRSIAIPIPNCGGQRGTQFVHLPIFKLFPILLAMLLSWLLCYILTLTNVFPATKGAWGYQARTDARASVLSDSKWIRVPYPGQWGMPTVSVGAIFGMLAGVLASMMESIADYYACARLSGAPPPPPSAINRGILVEGIGCLLAGVVGTGSGTTSYSENVGAIGITKVGSRRVVLAAAGVLILMGCVGKVGALFVTIPDPVVGGMFIAMFGMIVAVGLSNLQFVNLKSSRNLFVLAFSLFIGFSLPVWMSKHRNAIDTGSAVFDQVATVLCSTSMFIGGFVGFFLDITLPGTPEERGIISWRRDAELIITAPQEGVDLQDDGDLPHRRAGAKGFRNIYDFPWLFRFLNKIPLARFIPVCPASDDPYKTLAVPVTSNSSY
ncbi:hypothetical protein RRG08_008469 [Elysia crispata]|uniref:Solute carrier family 23 member 1 n=1 Tax=Elysia crispata TaxID=231223 RepID=A0AAE0ZQ93_9GAST|nr:hypothetical protein RRG08_008469 [Elysia crispata]